MSWESRPTRMALCGGNDAARRRRYRRLTEPGDANVISGMCATSPTSGPGLLGIARFHVRAHVLPNRWLTFFVLNTGGVALDWFRETLCRELDRDQFYRQYLPATLDAFLSSPDVDERERALPTYVPFLGGDRYSLGQRTAEFDGVSLQTTREDLLLAVVRGNLVYLGDHLRQVARLSPVNRTVGISGGAARIEGMLAARERWTGDFDYIFQDQSSLRGAAMLGRIYQSGPGRLKTRAPTWLHHPDQTQEEATDDTHHHR